MVRIAWLTKKGVLTGKAAWITTMEIVADVFVGTFPCIHGWCSINLTRRLFHWNHSHIDYDSNLCFLVPINVFFCSTCYETTFILFAGSSKVCSKGKGANLSTPSTLLLQIYVI